MLLAVDTATRTASIALFDGENVRAECTWLARENHTVELLAQVIKTLDLARLKKSDLTAVAVALGPGSFTGLRVGMSVAKGLAFAGKIPLLGIPTLDIVARAHSGRPGRFWAVISAGRGRYSVAAYKGDDDVVSRTTDYALVDGQGLAELAAVAAQDQETSAGLQASEPAFCGEIDLKLRELLLARFGTRARIASAAMNLRRAGYLAELAWTRHQRGESDDTAALAPMYAPHTSVEGIAKPGVTAPFPKPFPGKRHD